MKFLCTFTFKNIREIFFSKTVLSRIAQNRKFKGSYMFLKDLNSTLLRLFLESVEAKLISKNWIELMKSCVYDIAILNQTI